MRPHPHCFSSAHIPCAISPRAHSRDLRISRTFVQVFDMLAPLAPQELSASKCAGGYHFRTRQICILSTFPTIVRPLLWLCRRCLIVSFVFRYFGLIGELNPTFSLGICRVSRWLLVGLGLSLSRSGSNVFSGAPSSDECPDMASAAPQTGAQQHQRSPHTYL